MYVKKIIVSLILLLLFNLPVYSACTITGAACSINDIITKNLKTDEKIKNKKNLKKISPQKKKNKKDTIKNNHRTLFKSK